MLKLQCCHVRGYPLGPYNNTERKHSTLAAEVRVGRCFPKEKPLER